jgi:hypothetical protein
MGLNIGLWSIAGLVLMLMVLGSIVGATPKTGPAGQQTAAGETAGPMAAEPAISSAPTPSPVRATRTTAPTHSVPTATTAIPVVAPTGGIRINAAGAVLPDPLRTPGAINPAVSQATIDQTICVSGWTATVRPSSAVTTGIKHHQLATGYAYHGDMATGDYEEDHLISLELGGAPSAEANLWPEPYNTPDGARVKDRLENKLHALVCVRSLTLAAAQHAIASDWWAAYLTYVGLAPVPATSSTPSPAPAAATTPAAPAPVPGGPAGATALCNDGSYSYAAHHQGACSHHGGVSIFYK